MILARTRVAALAGTAALLAGGGATLAANGPTDRASRCEARLAKIAEARGLTVAELTAQIKAGLTARIQAALAAGRITPERAQALTQRVATMNLCKPGPLAIGQHAKPGMLRAAASYLGLTSSELRTQLRGTSLAALAQKQGKSVEGLKAAMLAPAKAKLTKAVESGRITQAGADQVLARLSALVDRLVTTTFPAG